MSGSGELPYYRSETSVRDRCIKKKKEQVIKEELL
jgi:hypothetical protein